MEGNPIKYRTKSPSRFFAQRCPQTSACTCSPAAYTAEHCVTEHSRNIKRNRSHTHPLHICAADVLHVVARIFPFFFLLLVPCLSFSGCSFPNAQTDLPERGPVTVSASGRSRQGRKTVEAILQPQAPGSSSVSNSDGSITLDYSNCADGYLMIRDTHDIKTQVQIKGPDGTTYPFPLTSREFTAFPLSRGNGRYEVSILELISGNNYAVGLSAGFDVNLTNEFGPYLYPSQYVRYTDHSDSVILARKLSSQSDSDLSYVKNVYKYITGHIKYDEAKATSIQPNYIPDADATLASGKGICFDYAVLMTAMLRSQNIPARLEVGYVGQIYHAWISVYLKEKGWIDDTISFDGQSWTLMDPTLAANNSTASIRKFTGDGSKYTVRYLY